MSKKKELTNKILKALNEILPDEEEQNAMIEYVQIMNISFAIILTEGSRDVKVLASALHKTKGFSIKESIESINILYPKMVENDLILEDGTLSMRATVNAMMYNQKLIESGEEDFKEEVEKKEAIPGRDYIIHFGEPGKA